MLEQLETSNLKPFSDTRGAKGEPCNGQRAERVIEALSAYSKERGDYCPSDDPDSLRDLIADTLHLAHSQGFDLRAIVADALINFRDETGVK